MDVPSAFLYVQEKDIINSPYAVKRNKGYSAIWGNQADQFSLLQMQRYCLQTVQNEPCEGAASETLREQR